MNWYTGNAAEDGEERRGWILGHFIDPSEGVRSSNDVEIKWGIHPVGDKRPEWTADDQRTTLVLLVQLCHDPAWSNEGLFALLQGFRRLAAIGGRRVNLPTTDLEV